MSEEQWSEVEEHIRRQQFEYKGRWRSSWRRQAEELRRAAAYLYAVVSAAKAREEARLLEELRTKEWGASGSRELTKEEASDLYDSNLIRTFFHLMALAVENLLKGILIGRQPELVADNGYLVRTMRIHDLVKLIDLCAIPTSDEERQKLRVLTAYIEWAGRYPIPLHQGDLPTQDPVRLTPDYVFSLCDQLWTQLEKERQAQGPHSP